MKAVGPRQPRVARAYNLPDVPGLAARQAAARLLGAVVDKHTSLDGLTDGDHGHPQFLALDGRDRALVRAILATALRYRGSISRMIAARLDRPLPPKASALDHLLSVAAAQMLFLDVPDRAAVDIAVEQAHADPRTRRFSALVNAVLRRLGRDKELALPAELAKHDEAPAWFRDKLSAAYGAERASAILRAHHHEAPVDFTVKADAAGWAERLGGFVLPTGSVRVARLAAPVPDLPGYGDGAWWVQDAAAALPVRLLGDVAGLAVADLCAAPGGKTAQLIAAGARVTAVDQSRSRLKRLAINLDRLGFEAEAVEADIASWRSGRKFDAVLLDAPCSSTGTVRRHPDVPWTKTEGDIEKLAGVQRRLLEAAISLARPGGRIVFSNCSLMPEEGEQLVRALPAGSGVRPDPVDPDEVPDVARFVTVEGFLRTTPADLDLGHPELSGIDGFFAARLQRL
ncbi:MAG: RsmB/NOP family class I SAM-dependent RNA methyltransferase [Rhizobiaceae bacterium]